MSKERKSSSVPKRINKQEELKRPVNNLKNIKIVKPNVGKRKTAIYEELNDILNNLHLDPILETFRTNEMLKEFFLKKILELVSVYSYIIIGIFQQ
jgi:hypothetical protein